MSSFDEIIVHAVEKVIPSVVNVSEVKLMADAYLRIHPVQGVGSGFVIDKEGYILTNAHVVLNSQEIKVTIEAGKTFSGEITGIDTIMDVAVVHVDAHDLPVPELAKKNGLKIGQMAIAIGSPLGLVGGPTVTVGVVSALNRSIQTEVTYMEGLIQTDAAINPGNSGGPLLDSSGTVIAINSAIIPFAQGIGFSIPIQPAMWIAQQLIEHGEVVRPWININAVDLNPKIVAYYNLQTKSGVMVTNVLPNSEAERSGFKPGDIIVHMADVQIDNVRDLIKVMNTHQVGDKVNVELYRGNEKMVLETVLEKAPSTQIPKIQGKQ
jgi:serine protease Do